MAQECELLQFSIDTILPYGIFVFAALFSSPQTLVYQRIGFAQKAVTGGLDILSLPMNRTSPPEGGFLTPEPLYPIIVILYPFIVSALFEEVVFRGLVLKMLLRKMGGTKKGIVIAFITSATLFGIVHSVHLFWDTPFSVFSSVIFAAAGGFFLGAIYLRTKTLVAPILLHALFNLASMVFLAFTPNTLTTPVEETLADFLVVFFVGIVPLTIAAFVMLRKVEPAVKEK